MLDRNQKTSSLLSRKDFLRVLAPLAGGALLAACTANRKESPLFLVKIEIEQTLAQFSPSTLTIPVGSRVIWQNISIYPQTVTCDPAKPAGNLIALLPSGATPWDSGFLYPGQKFTVTFTVPGDYLYFSRAPGNSLPSGMVRVS